MKFLHFIISFFSRTINIFVVVGLLVCLSASYISPEKFGLIAVLGFVFPIFVALNLLFVLIWILRKRWFFMVSFIALVLSAAQIVQLIGFRKSQVNSEPNIKIMSYNVRNFDLYNWSENKQAQDKIFETIEEENPDIICFQEFYTDASENFNTIKRLKKLGYKHYFFVRELVLRNTDEWGIATFSKLPIVSSNKILKEDESNSYKRFPYKGISTDVIFQDKQIRIFNVHLQSIHFGRNEYQVIEDLKGKEIEENAVKKMLRKLRNAFQKRAVQTRTFLSILEQQKQPYIICGDLNDLPNSYTYNKLAKNMNDAFLQNNIGIGQTFNRIPLLRIDYILTTKDFKTSDCRVIKNRISDHYPIVSKVGF